MTITRTEKFTTWSAARQFYSVMIANGYYAVYNKVSENNFIVEVYDYYT
jgi:hypothetical protein